MSGIRLEEMYASDMLDVIHFLFEDDMAAASGEQSEARSQVRTILYREFYEKEYRYKSDSSSRSDYRSSGPAYADGSPIDTFDDLEAFDPLEKSKPTKPFIPTTNFDPDSMLPFGKDLDAPLA